MLLSNNSDIRKPRGLAYNPRQEYRTYFPAICVDDIYLTCNTNKSCFLDIPAMLGTPSKASNICWKDEKNENLSNVLADVHRIAFKEIKRVSLSFS